MSIIRNHLPSFEVIPKDLKDAAKWFNELADFVYSCDMYGVLRVSTMCIGLYGVVLTVYHTERVARATGEYSCVTDIYFFFAIWDRKKGKFS